MPDQDELALAAEGEAVVRRQALAEEALRSELGTPSAQCVVSALVAPWVLRSRRHDAGPLPPADVLLAAFALLGEDPPPAVVEEFVAAEPVEQRAVDPPPPPSTEVKLRFVQERVGHAGTWRLPDGVDLAVHVAVGDRLRALDAVARRTGIALPYDEVLANPRWWPGRPAEPHALGNSFYQMFRRWESQGLDVTWLHASHDAQDLLYKAAGLPTVSPEVWVVAATDHAMRLALTQRR